MHIPQEHLPAVGWFREYRISSEPSGFAVNAAKRSPTQFDGGRGKFTPPRREPSFPIDVNWNLYPLTQFSQVKLICSDVVTTGANATAVTVTNEA